MLAEDQEARDALQIAEYLRIVLGRDEFTASERARLVRLLAEKVVKAWPVLGGVKQSCPPEVIPYVYKMLGVDAPQEHVQPQATGSAPASAT